MLTLTLVLAARLIVVPGIVDAELHQAARAVGAEVIDPAATRAALALVDDPACRQGDARCLARLALVAEADAAVVSTGVNGERIDVVVVTAAAERRRIQSMGAAHRRRRARPRAARERPSHARG